MKQKEKRSHLGIELKNKKIALPGNEIFSQMLPFIFPVSSVQIEYLVWELLTLSWIIIEVRLLRHICEERYVPNLR